MIMAYSGNYPYNRSSVTISAPDNIGVYYCGSLNQNGGLGTMYIGRALGDGVTIKSRLIDHLVDKWTDVTHFGYRICTTKKEAEDLETNEIQRLQPKYNKIGKGW